MKIKLRNLLTEVTRREATNLDRAARFNKNTSDFLNTLSPFRGAINRKNNDIRDNFEPSKLDTNILKTRDGISKIAGDIGYNPIKSSLLGLGSSYVLSPDLEESTKISKVQVTENLGFGAPSGVATGTNTPTNGNNGTGSSGSPKKIILRDKALFGNKKSKTLNENYIPNLETISKNFNHLNLNKVDQKVKDYASTYGIDINGMNLHTYLPEKQMELVKNKQMGIK